VGRLARGEGCPEPGRPLVDVTGAHAGPVGHLAGTRYSAAIHCTGQHLGCARSPGRSFARSESLDMEPSLSGSSVSAVRCERPAHRGSGVSPGAFPLVRGCLWSGAGSNRRPSAFQVNRAKRCADLRKRTSLTSGTALGGRCTTHDSRAPESTQGSERDDWRSPRYSSTTTWRLSGSSAGTPATTRSSPACRTCCSYFLAYSNAKRAARIVSLTDRGPDRAGPMTPEHNRATQPPRATGLELAVKQLYRDGRAAAGMAREDARARPQRQIRARSSAHVTVTRTGPARCPFLLRATPESPEVADARIPRAGHGR
jgi:hypothetical protein